MPNYKVVYFAFKGMAEPIRFMLSYMGEDFEDSRFTREEWPALKPTTPFGKVPVLEIDGKQLHQSVAITRYLGKQAKLAGKNDWEDLQIDMAVETFNDFRLAALSFWYEPNETVKAEKKAKSIDETIPYYFGKFDALVKANGGYLANGALSWGDIYFVALSELLESMLSTNCMDNYPNLLKLKEKVTAIPNIKAWIEKRPESDF